MIKLILFDLDGVLIDTKQIHYKTLNEALGEQYAITELEHAKIYDGLKTSEKLKIITEKKGLPVSLHEEINNKKQRLTFKELDFIEPTPHIIELFKKLISNNYKIGVCSNSIRKTVIKSLSKSGLIEYLDIIISNEDVRNSKPHPEMYWKAMSMTGFNPEETIIVEDSPPGIIAAQRSGAFCIRVANPNETTYEKISKHLGEDKKVIGKWKSENLNIVIPMAGAGSRFASAGYSFPKPLIQVNGKPMIQLVVENIGMEGKYHFIVQKEHREKYNLDNMLNLIAPDCVVVEVNSITEGAACTVLLAKNFINNNDALFLANSDQYTEWNPVEFMYNMQESDCDGGILTFKGTHPKWSFAKLDEYGYVTKVAEKNPISNNATVGFYYWKKGLDFVKYAEQMIEKNIRVNNEFYVCPVYNEAIVDGKKIKSFEASSMWGLGTPEDLEYYLREYKK